MYLGIHISKDKNDNSIFDSITNGINNLNINCIQIFVIGPRNTKENNIEKEKIRNLFIDQNKIQLFIHSNYVSNIWYSDDEFKDKENKIKCMYQINVKIKELEICDYIQGKGVVIHISSVDLSQVESSLERICSIMYEKNIQSQLIIEMSATKPTENTYETPIKLNKLGNLLNKINSKYNKNMLSICIDTSHIWAGGVDISSYINTKNYFDEINNVTKKLISIIHFNANMYKCGSGRDTHMKPFEENDLIWNSYNNNKNESGVRYFIEFCNQNNIPIICERHNPDTTIETLKDELKTLKNFINI